MNTEELKKNEFWQKKIYKVAKIRDVDGDGLITKADYYLIFQRYKDMGTPEEHLKKLEKIAGDICKAFGIADGSTGLTYEEYVQIFQESLVRADLDKILGVQFESIDGDGNGEISLKEWTDHYRAMGLDTNYAKPSFEAMDTNGDGIVSKEEFFAYLKEFYFSVEDKLKSSIVYGPLD